ncbi:hypothetical protein L2E82_31068 [Cichorium intybus]|uniref:Uncharacterized protein n=1 Tax=Cichorium intybus TaxID=13427 RepID=A0ACB9D2E2_CICIN|nr:hypothetical protein L2E82_31068 [Cichorium intybus]
MVRCLRIHNLTTFRSSATAVACTGGSDFRRPSFEREPSLLSTFLCCAWELLALKKDMNPCLPHILSYKNLRVSSHQNNYNISTIITSSPQT